MAEGLGEKFIGTSNVLMAMGLDLEAIGTNAHELPMIEAALANSDEELITSPYRVLEAWSRTYEKLLIFSDGLTVDTIEEVYHRFHGRVRLSFGWGTHLTNDFRDCSTKPNDALRAISLVCKVTHANGKPTVKLSDNFQKATGPASEIERYRKLFGTEDMREQVLARYQTY